MFLVSIFKYAYMVVLTVPPNTQAYDTDVNTSVKKSIVTSINYTIDPCDNFYDYACGDYTDQHRTKSYQEMTSLMDYQYNKFILNLLDNCFQYDYQVERCQSFVEMARIYLKACRGENKRNLRRYFEEIKPGPHVNWPILQKLTRPWSMEEYDVWTLLGKLQSYGFNNALINHEISVGKNGEFNIIIEPAYSENNSTLPDFNILDILLMGMEVKDSHFVLNSLRKTDGILLNILEDVQELNEESQTVNYGDLKQLYPQLNLNLYLKELLNSELRADTEIVLKNPEYFQYLNDYVSGSLQMPQWCNYLTMKFLFYLAVDSTAEFKSLDCAKDLRNKMDLAVNFLYYQQKYAFEAKLYNSAVNEIFENIRDKFSEFFMSNRLNLTEIQVQFLLDKLHDVRLNIGNLPDGITIEQVEKYYENVPPLDRNNYYKNHLYLLKHRFQKSLHYPQSQTHFIVTDNRLGSSSGAFYVPLQNMIVLPFGSLMYPLFDAHYHNVYKYSLLGFILAHEFTHAFDTTGLSFDGMGLIINEESSDIVDNSRYQDSLNCLQSQLPTDSIDERIADIVGIDLVSQIFADMNPNGNTTVDQLRYYYLNLAQFFCGQSNIKFLDHDSDSQRLNQIVMNAEDFQYAFQCHSGSKMNPIKRCRLY